MRRLVFIILAFILSSCSKQQELEKFGSSLSCSTSFEKFRLVYAANKAIARSHKFIDNQELAVISVVSSFDQYELFVVFDKSLDSIYYSTIISKPFYSNIEQSKLLLDCSKSSAPHED